MDCYAMFAPVAEHYCEHSDYSKYPGRFANHFIRNLFMHMIAEKMNLDITYGYENVMNELGIRLFHGTHIYPSYQNMTDNDILQIIQQKKIMPDTMIKLSESYLQSRDHSLFLHDYVRQNLQQAIRLANPYRDQYGTNRHVFLHIRLGDVPQHNPGYDYYQRALSQLDFDKGYISSDSPYHETCRRLLLEFPKLELFSNTEPKTIQFGSTCKYIVLSHGSFSFTIGTLGFDSTVYFPPYGPTMWHGDMFCIPGWVKVE